tara:strand:- start:62318 stop:63013 length:696 start_codon:yes stop_codon:yes gene_type:complete
VIGYVQGRLLLIDSPHVLLNAGGVGYEIEVPLTAALELTTINAEYALYTHLVVREDAQLLYGFLTRQDRDLFRVLLKVSGIGPKLAVNILSHLTARDLVALVRAEDLATFTRLPGIGKKTAERLLIELRDRLANWSFQQRPDQASQRLTGGAEASESGDVGIETMAVAGTDEGLDAQSSSPAKIRFEAETALIALGYKPPEATRMITAVYTDALTRDELIRQALRSMVKGK